MSEDEGNIRGFAATCTDSEASGNASSAFGWRLCESVEHWASLQPSKTAFNDSQNKISYKELADLIAATRNALHAAGVCKGDCVVAVLPSSAAFPPILFASMQLGANLVPLDVLLTAGEVSRRLDIVKPSVVFVCRAEHAHAALQCGCKTIGVGDGFGEASGHFGIEPFDCFLAAAEIAAGEEVCASAAASSKRPALTIFTSGTTGQPKGVLLSEANLEYAVMSINMAVEAEVEDVFLTSLPFSHIYGINTGILLPMAVGATSVLLPKFKADDSLDAVQRHRVSVYNGVPSVYRRMMASQAKRPRDLSTMRTGTIAGAKCTNLEGIRDVLHCETRILYGSTECPIVAMTRPGDSLDEKVTGVGRFNPTVVPGIMDEQGDSLAPGCEGEVVCQSPGTMLGYLNSPKATRECIDEAGWMHTGDIGFVDENGYLQVVGRKDDVINRGGYKVHPAEVEGVYNSNPEVFDCSVMGFPHAELGQQIVLFASLTGGSLTPSQLRCWAKDKLAKYKIPDRVILLEKIPYLPTGKLDKQAMIALYEAEEAAE